MKELIDKISSRLRDQGIKVPEKEIKARLEMLVENYKVPENEARRSVLNYFLKEHGVAPARIVSEPAKIADIVEPNRWIDLEVKVLQLWEPTSETISQTGLIGDETGKIKFVKWARDNLPDLIEGKSYLIKKAVTDEFQGRFAVKLTRTSKIEELPQEIQSPEISAAPPEDAKIGDVKTAGSWINLKAKVLQLWDANSDTVSQSGLIGDETGSMKFVKWEKSNLPALVEGKSYLFKNAVTDEYLGRFSIKLNKTSQIEELKEDVAAKMAPLAGEETKILEIVEPGRWVNLKVKVIQLWDSSSESIAQSGLVGDETGSVRFVKWAKADLPDLAEGKSYHLKNAITDEYQARFSIKLNRSSQIEELDEDIEVGSHSVDFSGALVDLQKGSGLIKRCPICRRSLAKGICSEHGKVDGSYDLRIKAVLDDGRRVQDIIINRETTERLVGITLEEAKKMAMDALDHEVVRGIMEERLLGRYYRVTGPRIDRYILVETINEAPAVDAKDLDELISLVEVL